MSHPYMPLFVADYMGDTAHLTTLEHGAYMLLIMTYWQRGKALPADSQRLANIARMSADEWARIAPTLSELFSVADQLWTHPRIEKELVRAREKSAKAKASADRRHGPKDADAVRTHSEGNANAQRRQCFSDSDSDKNIKSAQTVEQDAARERPKPQVEQILNFDSNGKIGGRRTPALKADGLQVVKSRAEGFGLDVSKIEEALHRSKPKNPVGYFITLSANQMHAHVPAIVVETCKAAMRGDLTATKLFYEARNV